MKLPQSNTQIPVCSYTRTELLSLRTKTSLLSLSTVDRLKDLNIGYHLPRRHRSSRGVKRKKHNLQSFIVASFNAQSMKGNDMACKRCEISTSIKDNGVDLFFVTETWLSPQGDEVKTVELAPSGFDVKSFPRQSRSRGGGIATVYKSTLGSSITFKTNFDFAHTSFEVVQASITLQHNTLHFFCLYRPPPKLRNNLTDSMFTEQLPEFLDYVNSLPGFVCLVGDMNIHFDNPLQSLTKQTLTTLCLYDLVQVINKPTHRCGHIIDWVIVRLDDVPQGSVLGPIIFTMYIKPLSAIIASYSIIHHSFADDLQLQMSAPHDKISELLHSMQSCISDIKAWATANMLRLDDNQTELMLVTSNGTKHLRNLSSLVTIGNAQIPFK